jgi:hypothetical protein
MLCQALADARQQDARFCCDTLDQTWLGRRRDLRLAGHSPGVSLFP